MKGGGRLSGTSAMAAVERAGAAAPVLRRRRARLAWALVALIAGAVLFACYLRQSRTVSAGSDGVAGAMAYTLLVLTAALLARGRTRGTEGVTRALVAAGIMLAPQLGPGTKTLLLSPGQTGTSVPVLLVFLLIDRSGDRAGTRGGARWYVPVLIPFLVWLGLAWTALADAMTIFVAIIPLALACVIRTWHGVARDREPPRAYRREASLAVAAALAINAAQAATALIRAHGGWQVNGVHTALAAGGQLAGNARLAGAGLLELFGADVFAAAAGVGTALAAVHLVGLALAAAGLLTAARQFLRRDRLIEAVLVTGIVIDLAASLAGVQAVNILSTREIAPVLPFAAVLAGRCLAPPCPARRSWLCAFLALYAAGLGYAAAQPGGAPGPSGRTPARAVASSGPPATSHRYNEYEILVWRRGANLLTHLRGDQSETPAAPKDR
jgi:hypothetical protein